MRNLIVVLFAIAGCGLESRRVMDAEVPGGGVVEVADAVGASAAGEYESIAVGRLTIRSMDRNQPSACEENRLVMGQTGVRLASFELEADDAESVEIWEFTISFTENLGSARSTIRNVRLTDEAGNAYENADGELVTTAISENLRTPFYLFITVPAGGSRQVHLYGDVVPAVQGASSGIYLGTTVKPDCCSLEAYGARSGHPFYATDDRVQYDSPWGSSGKPFRVFAASLTVELAPDTPSGLSTPAMGQLVAHYIFRNGPNEANRDVSVDSIHAGFATTIQLEGGSPMIFYLDDRDPRRELFRVGYHPGPHGWEAGSFSIMQPFTIPAGSSRHVYVTLDTDDAGANKTLTFVLQSVYWSDGVDPRSIDGVCGLPLYAPTLSY